VNNKLVLILLLFIAGEMIGKTENRRLGKLHNSNWTEYYNLGSNLGSYAAGINYPDFSCVGALLSKNGILGTGTLISSNVVVTAAHVLKNTLSTPSPRASDWEFILDSEYENASQSSIYEVDNIIIHPAWTSRLNQNGGAGDGDILGVDLALVILKNKVEGVYPAKLNYGNIESIGAKVFLAGFGNLVDGLAGTLSAQNIKRLGGENSLDRVVVQVNAPLVSKAERGGLLAIDFDSPQQNTNSLSANSPLVDYLGSGISSPVPLGMEASTAVGDSGGPAFIMVDGAWRAIGTVSYGTSDSTYGDITVYTRLTSQVEWLQTYLPNWTQARSLRFEGWLELDWLGSFFNSSNNWNFHTLHGWFYSNNSSGESFWAWQGNHLGWWWSGRSVYPFLYSYTLARWLYIDVEQSGFNKIIYFDYQEMRWKEDTNSR
jgi:hypothetical protein